MKNRIFIIAIAFTTALIVGCQKENGRLQVRLTDAPGDYLQVNVEVEQVKVKMNGDDDEWVGVQTHHGIYNLLDLQNGLDTLIAEGDLPEGEVKEIRLILGDENSVMLPDSTVHELETPSAEHSGFKIKLNRPIDQEEVETIIIDFDAGLSVKNSSDKFILSPVLTVK